jgi:methionyl-tRNA formyltransferase
MAVRMAELGHAPVGALSLSSLDRATFVRKLGQWGVREVARFARAKLIPQQSNRERRAHNPYLQPLLKHGEEIFRSIGEVAEFYDFPIAVCTDQNAPDSIARLKEWSPDLIIFTGGNILRKQLLELPRLGVLNVHLGLLPEVRGMSSPEWSLLTRVPVGITIHYMDTGIDTGAVLQRYEFPDVAHCESLGDLRNRLIAFGIAKTGEVLAGLDRGTLAATPQSDRNQNQNQNQNEDRQFFVMHEWLQARAAEQLTKSRQAAAAGMVHG